MSIADKLVTVAENTPKVYEAGKKAEYDKFWDAFQENGNRTAYSRAFSGRHWNEQNFNPKYRIAPTSATYMFENFNNDTLWENRRIRFDISKYEIDFSTITDASYLFYNSRVEGLFCDLRNATKIFYAFGSPNNGSIENLTIRVSEKCTDYGYAFYYQTLTTRIIFTEDSVIAASVSFAQTGSLSRESIESIISAISETVTGKTLTLNKSAVNKAFETGTGLKDGANSTEWQALVATKPNWTISLS